MLDLTQPIAMLRPPIVQFGVNSLSKLPLWLAGQGYTRPFIVADAFNAARLDCLHLEKYGVFGEVEAEPSTANLQSAVDSAERAGADVIIGFGGGSAMDLAKLVAVLINHDVPFEDISGPDRAPARTVGLVQIPTTAGTGSEAGTRALVTDVETHGKVATESTHMLADLAIIDPVLTSTIPPEITAATGIDAMAHCVEAYTSKRAHPLVDDYALNGIRLIGQYLKRAVEDGDDLDARSGLALASFYGGICLGPVNTTAGHAVAYPLGTRFGLPHGIANALIFPHTLAVNASAVPERTREITAALGFSGATEHSILDGARAFCEGLGLNMSLRTYGVKEDDLGAMAKEAFAIRRLLDWNPVDLSVESIENLYRQAW